MSSLFWLPELPDWGQRLSEAGKKARSEAWADLVLLAKCRLDLVKTERLARAMARLFQAEPPQNPSGPAIRLALLGSSTVEHLVSSIRVAGLRRGLWIDVHTTPYGQYFSELTDPSSALHAYNPNVVLFAPDARHLVSGAAQRGDESAQAEIEAVLSRLSNAWSMASKMGAHVLQQEAMPVFPPLLGSNEHRLPWSPRALVDVFNQRVRALCDTQGVNLVSLMRPIERDGLTCWHDASLWFRAKQEVHPVMAPLYGDYVGRAVAACFGRSSKCLVLDLDNTLWGGVIGDDGLEGIVLGQGNAIGEAHLALQTYAHDLSRRGIILAVCSKNEEANALEPFEKHPEMKLRRSDIACFVANWQDKATNLRQIAQQLNIGLDSLVFVDDNPFERNIIRKELPMVEVPELGEDPTTYVQFISDAGYFEAATFTIEDSARASLYQNIAAREAAKAVTDIGSYLQSLHMQLRWRPFDEVGASRITQLINKSNQFNLTTQRYTVAQVQALIGASRHMTLQLRLTDSFGDNGIISVIIVRPSESDAMVGEIDSWLMSCRVLGRSVEQETLNLMVGQAQLAGFSQLLGIYRPTAKNGMVADHYQKMGFSNEGEDSDGSTYWRLKTENYVPMPTYITLVKE